MDAVMSCSERHRNRHTSSKCDAIRRLACLCIAFAIIIIPSAGQSAPQNGTSPPSPPPSPSNPPQPQAPQNSTSPPSPGTPPQARAAANTSRTAPPVPPSPGPRATGASAADASQTIRVFLSVVLRQGSKLNDTAVAHIKAALERVGCEGGQDAEVLASEATPACEEGLAQGGQGQRVGGNGTGGGGPCRRVAVEALVVASDPESCVEKILSTRESGTFLNETGKAFFEVATIEAASVVHPPPADASGTRIREEGGDCPLNDSLDSKLGLYEGLGCDACDCILDPGSRRCAAVAGKICASPVPSAGCPTLQSRFLSEVEEEVILGADAIVDRCPRLDKSTDICECLENADSNQCVAAVFRGCGIHPSLCIDKIEVLTVDSSEAKLRVLKTIANACGEDDLLLVHTVVIAGASYVTFIGASGQGFRQAVADLAEVDIHQVTLLSRQEGVDGLRVTFAVYAQDPVSAEERIVEADTTGYFSAMFGDAPLQATAPPPAAPAADSPPSFSSVRGWFVLLIIMGAILVATLLGLAARSNRAFVRRHGLPAGPAGPKGDAISSGSSEQESSGAWGRGKGEGDGLEEGTLDSGKDGGELSTMGSYSLGCVATHSSHSVNWPGAQRSGRPALEINSTLSRSNSEKRRQFRTIRMSEPFISYSGDETDDQAPGDGGISFTVNPLAAPQPLFPSLDNNSWFTVEPEPASRKSDNQSASTLHLLTTSGDFFSADDHELLSTASGTVAQRPSDDSSATPRRDDAPRMSRSPSFPLAISTHCPPSPAGRASLPSAPRTPGSRDAVSSLVSSSDLEFDVEEGEERVVSQYVNYLYDEPATSRSQTTNRSFHSEIDARERT
ncbi:unnamed protein product [Ostreobium quekettii]|uniref:Uncharacterized protein n=1 Tax=Ostreobium quekettii TaxID=121088 RepID=A0A8S1IWK4_9CHLO|nr:unnamed protein product [Ostreobium quekettii]